MSTKFNAAELLLANVDAPVQQRLDLEIKLINDTVLRSPWAASRMNFRAPRVILAAPAARP